MEIIKYCKNCKKLQPMFEKGVNELYIKNNKGKKVLRCKICFQKEELKEVLWN